MRTPAVFILVLAALTVGCASQSERSAAVHPELMLADSAPALAFTPSCAAGIPILDRSERQTVAYAGYESQIVSETYTRQDDRQRWNRFGGDDGSFERRSISTTVTVRSR